MAVWSRSKALTGAPRRAAAAARAAPSNPASSGSGPRRRKSGWLSRAAAVAGFHQAEAPRVVIDHRGPVIGLEHEVVVAAGTVTGEVFATRRPDMPRWARTGSVVVEMEEQIFRAPRERDDTAGGDAPLEIGGHRPAQIAPADNDAREPPPFEQRGEAAADRLDLGKFGHEAAQRASGGGRPGPYRRPLRR